MDTKIIGSEYLKVNGAAVKDYALTSGTSVYSDAIRCSLSHGYASLLVILTGGSDDVDISMEVSDDGKIFYTPYTTDGTTLTSVGPVVTTLTATRWIVLTPRMAKFMRFLLDPDANSTITAKYLQQE